MTAGSPETSLRGASVLAPVTDAFLRDPEVLTPEQALELQPEHSDQLGPGQAPETVVVIHARGLFDLVAEALEAEPTGLHAGPAELYVSDGFGGAGLCHPGPGGAAVALVTEKLIAAGAKRLFSLGFATAIEPNAEAGEVCLIDGAVPQDGVTSHYAAPGYTPRPDQGLTKTLREGLEWGRQGQVWTTAAPYRKTEDAVDRMREAGVLAVDMETAPVLTVAAYRGVPAAAVLVTADAIRGHDHVPNQAGMADEAVKTAVRGLIAVLKGLRNLSRGQEP